MSFLTLSDIEKFENFDLPATQVVEGFITGMHRSPYHGFSVEFSEYRPYNSGESIRNIDWKLYAKTDKLFIKRFEEETNLRCNIIIDISASMNHQGAGNNKLKFSLFSAAILMNLLKRQRDAFGLTLLDETIHYQSEVKSSDKHYRNLLKHLEDTFRGNYENKKSNLAQQLHHIAEQIHKRSLVIIFSDFFSTEFETKELFDALQHLKFGKHEIILFRINDTQHELEFDFASRPYHFIDPETGADIKLNPAEVRSAYIEKVKDFETEFDLKCVQNKIEKIDIDANKDFSSVITPFFVKRSKMY